MKSLLVLTLVFLLGSSKMNAQAVACTMECPSNIIVTAETGTEGANVTFPNATSVGECGAITYTPASGSFFRLGSHSVIAMSESGKKCSFTVTVTDNEAPRLSDITLSSKRLWPVSNKMKRVAVFYKTSDIGEEVNTFLSVTSNDATPGVRDWEVIDNHMLRLKASRLSNGEPRIYTITVTSTDGSGNISRSTTSIAVSRTMLAGGGIVKE